MWLQWPQCAGHSALLALSLNMPPHRGAGDDDTDGTALGGWAGLNGHVSVECRPPIFIDGGVGSIIPPHVTYPLVTTASAGKPLAISVALLIRSPPAQSSSHCTAPQCTTPLSCKHHGCIALAHQPEVAARCSGGSAIASVEIFDTATNASVGKGATPTAVTGNATVSVTVPAVKLWSPEEVRAAAPHSLNLSHVPASAPHGILNL